MLRMALPELGERDLQLTFGALARPVASRLF
jgi:hypothetical protein